jgi:hypothetical protein
MDIHLCGFDAKYAYRLRKAPAQRLKGTETLLVLADFVEGNFEVQ